MRPLCIYHGKCADGFTSAWAVWKAIPDAEFYSGVYGEEPPDMTDREVILVDFSYKRAVLEKMAEKAVSILILDHHKTAKEDLAPFINENLRTITDHTPVHRGSVQALFDMERSGAGITWDFFHPAIPRPALVRYVEDRDLWRFQLLASREVNAYIFSFDYAFSAWEELARTLEDECGRAVDGGRAIERKHHKDVAELVGVCKRRLKIGGQEVWGASIPYTLTSDAGNLMAQGEPFAACYWDTPKGRVFSLRSTQDGADVSLIAKGYGGGGHKNASGFQVPLTDIGQFEL